VTHTDGLGQFQTPLFLAYSSKWRYWEVQICRVSSGARGGASAASSLLTSGRYRAAYTGPDGRLYRAPRTFDARDDAVAWLSARRAEIMMEIWAPEVAARRSRQDAVPTFRVYADPWLENRKTKGRELRPTTRRAPDTGAARRRPRPRRPTPHHRRRQPRPAALRSRLRCSLRGQPHPSQQRQDQPPPAQSSRRPRARVSADEGFPAGATGASMTERSGRRRAAFTSRSGS
jgi:hypothetical protein